MEDMFWQAVIFFGVAGTLLLLFQILLSSKGRKRHINELTQRISDLHIRLIVIETRLEERKTSPSEDSSHKKIAAKPKRGRPKKITTE